MKNILFWAAWVSVMCFVSCEKYDDTKVWDKLNDHENRITKLEEFCAQMNTNISSLQSIINALQQKEFVTAITPINKDGKEVGYTITFTSGKNITIYHGQDGKNGQNGKNGKDGQDGYTPIIGVKQALDGIYYWTIDGEWMLDDNGKKVKAEAYDGKDGETGVQGPIGEPGQDGQNGKDGATPQLKIEDDYWYVSYDEGQSWIQLGKAISGDSVDSDGSQGGQCDSFFQSVTQDADNVYFVLADGTTITIPKVASVKDIVLTYIPRYSDGKATVFYTDKADSYVTLDFEVSPASEIGEWKDIATIKAVYTESRAAVDFVDLEILAWSSDKSNGTITIKSSGKNLSDQFFAGEQEASVRLVINGSNINIISDYIPMVAKSIVQSNNEIWYTSTDGNVVNPSNEDAFSANIESNIYENGRGIITFDKDITEIGDAAFQNCSKLLSVTIPNGVTHIGASAFNLCVSLSKINISDSVTDIGAGAFNDCSGLIEMEIPEGLKGIEHITFSGCSNLKNIIIPEGVTYIATGAFADCRSLTSISLPDSVTEIASDAFYGCSSLVAFYGKLASSDNRCVIISGVLNNFAPAELTSYNISTAVTEIGNSVFSDCNKLTEIIIPESVTKIGNNAFRYCASLTSITIPESVAVIGNQAFYECDNLKRVYSKPTVPPTLLLTSEVFGGTSNDLKIYVPYQSFDKYRTADGWKEYADLLVKYDYEMGAIVPNVPEQTEPAANEIWYTSSNGNIVNPKALEAFNEAEIVSNIYSKGRGVITFDRNLTEIGAYAFDGCSALTSVIIPKGVKIIGVSAFSDCSKLVSVVIPNSVNEIGYSAFFYCSSLTDITIPDSVRVIGESAFASCSSLTSVVIPDSVSELSGSLFASCRNLTSITIPNSVAVIGNSTFYNCTNLTSITIPNSVNTIGIKTFQNCRNLKAFYGKFASADHNALIADGVLKAFAAGSDATSYTIPDGVYEIESYAFYGCKNLKSVNVCDGVTIINGDTFYNCSGLTSVTLPDSVVEIKGYAFYGCSSLSYITIPNGVTSIGSSAFATCSSLTEVTIPANVINIGYAAFSGCSNLSTIYCKPETCPTGSSFMFADISADAKIYVPLGTSAAYKAADYWKEYASIIEEKAM